MQNVLSNVSEYHITLWIGPPSAITFSGIFKSAPIHHLIVTTLLESLSRLSSFEEPRMVLHGKIPTSIIYQSPPHLLQHRLSCLHLIHDPFLRHKLCPQHPQYPRNRYRQTCPGSLDLNMTHTPIDTCPACMGTFRSAPVSLSLSGIFVVYRGGFWRSWKLSTTVGAG